MTMHSGVVDLTSDEILDLRRLVFAAQALTEEFSTSNALEAEARESMSRAASTLKDVLVRLSGV